MPTKTHKDFHSLTVLNTILGGYFGSRLMTNIREDKGYTYGIGSGMIPLKKAGYFFISTEVGVEVCNKAIDEIYIEINRLRNESISEKELILVKNYMIGSFLRSIDGPFALANRFKSIMEYDLDYSYYDDYISTIKNIKASDLLNLANKYLDPNSMTEVVAGKR
jgi:predicted Zn-dependent peptidase